MFQYIRPPCLPIRAARGRLRVNSRQHRERQTACKPGSVPPCGGDGHSSGTSVAGRLARPTRAATRKTRLGDCSPDRSYLVLLPVGFTVPSPSPRTRCALTAPFHPCRAGGPVKASLARRFAFCGTVPGVAPAGRYPAPRFRGARTFLPLQAQRAAIRPSGREYVCRSGDVVNPGRSGR